MKLLFLTVIPTPYQRDLFRAIDATGQVDLSVFYYKAEAHDREWGDPELERFETVLEGRTFASLEPSAHWNPGAMKAIEAASPDLTIVSQYTAPTAQHVMRGLARRNMPFVFWGEMPGFAKRGMLGSAVRWGLQRPLDKAAAIAGIGTVAVDIYGAQFPGKPMFNIPYFCDLARFRDAAQQRPAQSDTVNILFSGQMIERKGVDVLLAAFDRIARRHPAARLTLLGGGPNRTEYQALVAPDLKDRVHFMGHQDPRDLPALFATGDIFCLPSRHDGWGVVVNEALGSGMPIVVTDTVGAGPDLVEQGANGFVTPVDDVSALEQALDTIVGNPALRQRMRDRSSELARRWDVGEGAQRWVGAAQQVLATRTAA